MIGEEGQRCNVSIHWPHRSARMREILRSGLCPSFGVPRRLRIPGGLVGLVAPDGAVQLLFRIARIDEGVSVVGANGRRVRNGCILVARKGSVRRPGARDPQFLPVNRNAKGAFAYFDDWNHEQVVFDPTRRGVPPTAPSMESRRWPTRHFPFLADNVGKTLSQPERALIREYGAYLGNVELLSHHPLYETGLFTDLFIPCRWTLIEAKAYSDRDTLRAAIGQLLDYQRYYPRSPRLALLLRTRPSRTMLDLCEKHRIVVIWKQRAGVFRDSADGALSVELRRYARARLRTD